jgi:hypothetical protein
MRSAGARVLVVAMLSLSIAAFAACGSDSGSDSDSSATVAGDEYSYTLPGGWHQLHGEELDQAGQALLGTASQQKPDQRIALSTAAVADEGTDGFRSSVNVTREPLPSGVTLDQYIRVSVKNLGALVQSPQLMRTPRRTDLGGAPAGALEYSGLQGGQRVIFVDVTAVRDGVAYNFTLSALPDQLNDAGADFRSMVDSWQWTS